MDIVNKNMLKITKYELLGKLPDPFLFDGGTRVRTPADFEKRRAEMYASAVELQYGTIPPAPEYFDVTPLYVSPLHNTYRITAGTKEKQLSFRLKLILPADFERRPIIVDGDLCFGYAMNEDFINAAIKNGVGLALFDRTELANDIQGEGRRKGAIYDIYEDYTFGAIGAWAWGYMRVVDALEALALKGVDLSCIAFTGHSRGGKTAALAGAVDTRAAIVNPNETCAGACGCYRIHMSGSYEGGEERRSETLADLWKNFGFWIGPGMEKYKDDEAALPFDAHYLKALVAPRVLFVSEAAGDIWANPVGSYQTTMAAREVFKFLGVSENLYWYFRPGTHYHTVKDMEMLVNVILHVHDGKPLCDDFSHLPFEEPEPAFDFVSP